MASDRILISRIDCLASLGVTAEERALKQHLSVDLEFLIDAGKAAATDSIKDTIDYAKVAATVAEVCASQPFHLIETIAERIAELAPERGGKMLNCMAGCVIKCAHLFNDTRGRHLTTAVTELVVCEGARIGGAVVIRGRQVVPLVIVPGIDKAIDVGGVNSTLNGTRLKLFVAAYNDDGQQRAIAAQDEIEFDAIPCQGTVGVTATACLWFAFSQPGTSVLSVAPLQYTDSETACRPVKLPVPNR